MDWILISYLGDCFIGRWLLITILSAVVVFISALVVGANAPREEDRQDYEIGADFFWKWIKRLIPYQLLFAIICTLILLPKIFVKANIARIKLRYTDMETVQKLEIGAEKVVDKLDKLIDAGIKKVEGE